MFRSKFVKNLFTTNTSIFHADLEWIQSVCSLSFVDMKPKLPRGYRVSWSKKSEIWLIFIVIIFLKNIFEFTFIK